MWPSFLQNEQVSVSKIKPTKTTNELPKQSNVPINQPKRTQPMPSQINQNPSSQLSKPAIPVQVPLKVSDNKPKCRALSDFEAENFGELPFNEGDIISITQKENGGWWQGVLNGTVGWFPKSFVEEIS